MRLKGVLGPLLRRREPPPPPPEPIAKTLEAFRVDPFGVLRRKWGEVPGTRERHSTSDLLRLSDDDLVGQWLAIREEGTTGPHFNVRGWYHALYADVLRGKRVMDVGSGLGIDGITFAERGARMTFVDILESNLAVVERVCRRLNVTTVDFCYLRDLTALDALPADYDVIWCQGSLINAPFDIMKREAQALLEHLPIGGRWIELAYPKVRWEREGRLPFDQWGERTDGPGTPWVEWYDLAKLLERLAPATFDVVLSFEFHNSDFNWFDLIRRS